MLECHTCSLVVTVEMMEIASIFRWCGDWWSNRIGLVPVIACRMEEIVLLENDLEGQTDSILCDAISMIH